MYCFRVENCPSRCFNGVYFPLSEGPQGEYFRSDARDTFRAVLQQYDSGAVEWILEHEVAPAEFVPHFCRDSSGPDDGPWFRFDGTGWVKLLHKQGSSSSVGLPPLSQGRSRMRGSLVQWGADRAFLHADAEELRRTVEAQERRNRLIRSELEELQLQLSAVPTLEVVTRSANGETIPASCPLAPPDAPHRELSLPQAIQEWSNYAEAMHRRLDKASRAAEAAKAEVQQAHSSIADNIKRTKRADDTIAQLIGRAGKGHIQRDTHQALVSPFPNGEDMASQFSKATIGLDMLLEDAEEFLGDLLKEDSAAGRGRDQGVSAVSVLSKQLLRPLYVSCGRWVEQTLNRRIAARDGQVLEGVAAVRVLGPEGEPEGMASGNRTRPPPPRPETLSNLFWLSCMQPHILRILERMDEEALRSEVWLPCIDAGGRTEAGAELSGAQALLPRLHQKMLDLDAAGEICYGSREQPQTLLTVAKFFLRFFALAELSEPRAALCPAPGVSVMYDAKLHTEVISGARTHGRIQDGDAAVVLFPGLSFWPEEGAEGVLPSCVCKALVYRERKK